MESPSESHRLKSELPQVPGFLAHFCRNPIHGIRSLPDWGWLTFGAVSAISALASSALVGFFEKTWIEIFVGMVIFPILSVATCLIISLFLVSFFSIYEKNFLDHRRVYGVVVFAFLPYLFAHLLSPLIPALNPIGFGLSSLLLVVGLVDHFRLPRSRVLQLVAGIFVFYCLVWIFGQIRNHWTANRDELQTPTPQSLDQMQKELEQSK